MINLPLKRAGIAGVIALGAALGLSACSSAPTTAQGQELHVNSDAMDTANTTVMGKGYHALTGTALSNAIRGNTFTYHDDNRGANITITYGKSGVAEESWVDETGEHGMSKHPYTIENNQYLCLWDGDGNDDCARVFAKVKKIATVDQDGNIAYYTKQD